MLTLKKHTAASVSTPAADKITLFLDDTDDRPKYRDDAGNLWQLAPLAGTVTDSTTTRSLTMSDAGKYLRFTNAGTKTLTVQDEADHAITQDSEFHGRNVGAGDLTIAEDTAVTVNVPAGGTLVIPQGGTFTLKRIAADEWDLIGVTVPA